MQLSHNLIVVDVETTGPNPFVHDLLSVAFVPVLTPERPLSVHVRSTELSWTDFARTNFSKFDQEWNQLAVSPQDALQRIEAYLDDVLPNDVATLVGQNVGFDLSFLRKLAFLCGRIQVPRISHRAIDTHTLLYLASLQQALPFNAVSSDAAFEFLGVSPPAHHRHTALGDALATRLLFLRLMDLLDPHAAQGPRRRVR